MKNIFLFICIIFLCSNYCIAQNFPDKIKKRVTQTVEIQKQIQKEEDKWAQEKIKLSQEYERLIQEVKDLEYENKELQAQKQRLITSIDSIKQGIKKTEEISRQIQPFLMENYDKLNAFVKIDLPFLSNERITRLNNLKKILDDPLVPVSEKYRKLMETFFIETEYGNTIESYQDKINIKGKHIYGTVFRLGRIAMFFLSPNENIVAHYNISKKKWEELPVKYARQIEDCIEISNKRRTIELLLLPIGKLGDIHDKK